MGMLHFKLALDLEPADIEDKLAREYDTVPVDWLDRDAYGRSYNLRPTSYIPVIRQQSPTNPAPVLHTMQWGLMPDWAKQGGNKGPPVVNSESVDSGSNLTWVVLRGKRRCAVVCQGFFVWRKQGKHLVPYYFKHLDSRLVLLAGLYDVTDADGKSFYTLSLLIHYEKEKGCFTPVVLRNSAALTSWLDTSSQHWNHTLSGLVAPSAKRDSLLKCHQVLPRIERERSSSPSMILPISERKDGVKALFTRQVAISQTQAAAGPPPGTADAQDARAPPVRQLLKPGPPTQKPCNPPKPSGSRGPKRRRARSPSVEEIDPPADARKPSGSQGPKRRRVRSPSVEEIDPPADARKPSGSRSAKQRRPRSPSVAIIDPPSAASRKREGLTRRAAGASRRASS